MTVKESVNLNYKRKHTRIYSEGQIIDATLNNPKKSLKFLPIIGKNHNN